MNLVEIAKSWYMLTQDLPELEEMVARRLNKCDQCPFKQQLSPAGEFFVGLFNEKANTFVCGLCGCPLAAKVVKPENSCPDSPKRWDAEVLAYY